MKDWSLISWTNLREIEGCFLVCLFVFSTWLHPKVRTGRVREGLSPPVFKCWDSLQAGPPVLPELAQRWECCGCRCINRKRTPLRDRANFGIFFLTSQWAKGNTVGHHWTGRSVYSCEELSSSPQTPSRFCDVIRNDREQIAYLWGFSKQLYPRASSAQHGSCIMRKATLFVLGPVSSTPLNSMPWMDPRDSFTSVPQLPYPICTAYWESGFCFKLGINHVNCALCSQTSSL
jgi:hypothetical protein